MVMEMEVESSGLGPWWTLGKGQVAPRVWEAFSFCLIGLPGLGDNRRLASLVG